MSRCGWVQESPSCEDVIIVVGVIATRISSARSTRGLHPAPPTPPSHKTLTCGPPRGAGRLLLAFVSERGAALVGFGRRHSSTMRSLAAILGALVATAAATVPDTSFLKIGEASRMLRASCGAKSVPHGRLLQSAGPECDLKLGDCALSSLTEGAWTTIRTKPVLVDDEMVRLPVGWAGTGRARGRPRVGRLSGVRVGSTHSPLPHPSTPLSPRRPACDRADPALLHLRRRVRPPRLARYARPSGPLARSLARVAGRARSFVAFTPRARSRPSPSLPSCHDGRFPPRSLGARRRPHEGGGLPRRRWRVLEHRTWGGDCASSRW